MAKKKKKSRGAFQRVGGRLLGERRKAERALTTEVTYHVKYRDPLTKRFTKPRGQSVVPEIWVRVGRLSTDRTQETKSVQKVKALKQRRLKRGLSPKQIERAVVKDVLVRKSPRKRAIRKDGQIVIQYPKRRTAKVFTEMSNDERAELYRERREVEREQAKTRTTRKGMKLRKGGGPGGKSRRKK